MSNRSSSSLQIIKMPIEIRKIISIPSDRKTSMTLAATERGRHDVKRVKNQELAYIDV